jgi:hypothetical protein
MSKLVKIEEKPGHVKDMTSGAVLIVDDDAYRIALQRKNSAKIIKSLVEKVAQLEKRIAILEESINN